MQTLRPLDDARDERPASVVVLALRNEAARDEAMMMLLTLKQAASASGFSVKTLRRAIKLKRLKCSQPNGVGGKILVSEESLNAWLSGSQVVSQPVVSSSVRPYRARRYA